MKIRLASKSPNWLLKRINSAFSVCTVKQKLSATRRVGCFVNFVTGYSSEYFHHLGSAKLDRSYEYLATPIAVMVWLYWSAFTLLMGAEINASLQS